MQAYGNTAAHPLPAFHRASAHARSRGAPRPAQCSPRNQQAAQQLHDARLRIAYNPALQPHASRDPANPQAPSLICHSGFPRSSSSAIAPLTHPQHKRPIESTDRFMHADSTVLLTQMFRTSAGKSRARTPLLLNDMNHGPCGCATLAQSCNAHAKPDSLER
jgi:hypothetical protein